MKFRNIKPMGSDGRRKDMLLRILVHVTWTRDLGILCFYMTNRRGGKASVTLSKFQAGQYKETSMKFQIKHSMIGNVQMH